MSIGPFSVAMITADRSPRANYLGQTLANLKRGGAFVSSLVGSFTVFNSNPKTEWLPSQLAAVDEPSICVASSELHRSPTENVVAALSGAAQRDAPWVLFLEDDIDVCAKFMESTAAWLEKHECYQHEFYRVFPLGANYAVVNELARQKIHAWPYRVEDYYGTLAVAMRRETAAEVAAWLSARSHRREYDLMIAEWGRSVGIKYFLTPCPSFVQHTGEDSLIRPGSLFHRYNSWPGQEWSYV